MRNLALYIVLALATSGLFASRVFAQPHEGDRGDGYYPGDRRSGGEYRGGFGSAELADRAFDDLQRAASSSYYVRHARGHFDHAMRELAKFQDKWRQGRFDRHALDQAIGEMSHLARVRELHPRVRDMLARDADDLRGFRGSGKNRAGYQQPGQSYSWW